MKITELPKIVDIAGTTYYTISEAIDNADSGDTIKLPEDVSLEEEKIIPQQKTKKKQNNMEN